MKINLVCSDILSELPVFVSATQILNNKICHVMSNAVTFIPYLFPCIIHDNLRAL
jgi:hypothetical protein